MNDVIVWLMILSIIFDVLVSITLFLLFAVIENFVLDPLIKMSRETYKIVERFSECEFENSKKGDDGSSDR